MSLLQPTLQDGVVRLRPLAAQDRQPLFQVASDPPIWAGHPASDRWREPVFDRLFDDAMASGGALAICNAATGAIMGMSRFDRGRAGPGEVEIGWTFLAREHWGGTINAAVKRLMIGHALASFVRVIFMVGETNLRSQHALARIGAERTGRELQTVVGDREIRHFVYAIDRDAFATGPLTRNRC